MPRRPRNAPIFLVWLHRCYSLAAFAFHPHPYLMSLISSCSSLGGAAEFQTGFAQAGIALQLLPVAVLAEGSFQVESGSSCSQLSSLLLSSTSLLTLVVGVSSHARTPTPLTWLFFRSEILKILFLIKTLAKGHTGLWTS